MGHIELARWADRIVVAPASADAITRLAAGLAGDLLGTLCLASDAPLSLAPAMNRVMWAHPATQANLATLRARGVQVLGPAEGDQACGEVGAGRMLEALQIVAALQSGGALAGATRMRSAQRASSMWPMAASAPSSHSELRTGLPVSAWKVSGVTKRIADSVMTTCTSAPASCSRRARSAAL